MARPSEWLRSSIQAENLEELRRHEAGVGNNVENLADRMKYKINEHDSASTDWRLEWEHLEKSTYQPKPVKRV